MQVGVAGNFEVIDHFQKVYRLSLRVNYSIKKGYVFIDLLYMFVTIAFNKDKTRAGLLSFCFPKKRLTILVKIGHDLESKLEALSRQKSN